MSEKLDEEKISLEEVSRQKCTCTREYWSDHSRTVPDLYEVVIAGSLQRIAKSLEHIEKTLPSVTTKGQLLSEYTLQLQVGKLRARLRKAGLDDDPNSDNRGRPKKEGT